MSKFTTQLRYICENAAGLTESKGLNDVETIINAARPIIFNFTYPITDTQYKPVLENKILWHYYMREIGLESVGLWKFYLCDKMRMIMPYYDQLYQSAALEYNPLYDVDYQIQHSGTKGENTTKAESQNQTDSGTDTDYGTDQGSDTNWIYENDTPQGGISTLENLSYLSSARKQTDANSLAHSYTKTHSDTRGLQLSGTGSLSGTDSYLNIIRGKMGSASYSKMLQEYRDVLINIDAMIIDELADLFMNIY